MRGETKCIHCGYTPKNSESKMVPIAQNTAYVFDPMQEVGGISDESTKVLIYSRFANPTIVVVEQKIADLEGGTGTMCTSSGQAAILLTILNLCRVGDSFISISQIYGETVNLSAVTLENYGTECIFVDADVDEETISTAVRGNIRLVFGETVANSALSVLDIEKLARTAYSHKIPLIINGTSATPVLCKPFEFSVDIVVHSTSKYMGGYAVQVGGMIIDSGNFDWTNGKFPEFTEPDESYYGITYAGDYDRVAYTTKARMQLIRDYGVYPAANSAPLLDLGLETFAVRMEYHCRSALGVANYLAASDKIEKVIYPGLESDKYYPLAKKYLRGTSDVTSFIVKGDKDNTIRLMDGLKLASTEVHVADIRTCVLHPANATHRQLTEEQLYATDVNPGMIHLSVGLENVEDIIESIEQGLSEV